MPYRVKKYLMEHFELDVWEKKEKICKEVLYYKIKNVHGIIGKKISVDEELLSNAPHLKIVSNTSVGYDNFNIDDMLKLDVLGTHVPGEMNQTMTDLVFGLMISTARRFIELDNLIREGKWVAGDDTTFLGMDIFGKTLGIIGLGRLGESVAKRAKAFNMDIIYNSRTRKKELEESLNISYNTMENLLKKSDFIVLLTPLTKLTHKLIGEHEFAKMKKSAIFINASRGETVDEKALVKALQNNWIFGAGLDVYKQEPIDRENPLLKMKNVVLLPHIGSATFETRERMAMKAAENLVSYLLEGKRQNVVKELNNDEL